MRAIVAVDSQWGIGYRGQLLTRIPEDMRHFKQTTVGKVVVMGRETFESLPKREPLKDRVNIVLSRNPSFADDRLTVCRSLEALFETLRKYHPDDVFVIGGASVYEQLLPYCVEAFVTRIDRTFPADKYLINLDKEPHWELISAGDPKTHDDLRFRYVRYRNRNIHEGFGREIAWPMS